MSNLALFQKSESLILAQETSFTEMAKIHNAVNFKREASFAVQILKNSSYLVTVANRNPDSLKNAILNIAAIGLTLSPVHKYAYLIPRDNQICLDISYLGLTKLGTDSGAIKWAVAELVYKKDNFKFKGHGHEPLHECDPFDEDRGPIVGGYCLAKTHNGEFVVTMMKVSEINKIRSRSESFKKDSGPWISDYEEMAKKTLIRRGSKSWPKTDTRDERFAQAIKMLEDVEIIDTDPVSVERSKHDSLEDRGPNPQFQEIRDLLESLGKEESKFLGYLATVNNRKIEAIEDLSQVEIEKALVQLYSWAKSAHKKQELDNANT